MELPLSAIGSAEHTGNQKTSSVRHRTRDMTVDAPKTNSGMSCALLKSEWSPASLDPLYMTSGVKFRIGTRCSRYGEEAVSRFRGQM